MKMGVMILLVHTAVPVCMLVIEAGGFCSKRWQILLEKQ